ncbi:MAG TPA: hypothetical protein PLX35_10395 [Cyclobacteriaceae bacterium]|nr:hypothetical protein [Cyclobacteriaceae bacterium]
MSEQDAFLSAWYTAMKLLGIISFALALIVYLIHNIRVSMVKEYKDKYDFLIRNEIKWYRWSTYFIAIGVAFLINLYGSNEAGLNKVGVWFFVRIFFGFAGGTLIGYVSYLVLEFYYPTKLNSKLKKWRYMPRVNPKSGHKMRLLSEEEEDVHLDEGRQAEESIFSIDYDVWLDEKTGDVKIEKYLGHLTALKCNNCGFFTMKVIKEEITQRYEDESPKELLKHYKCAYCKNIRATAFVISRKEADDYKKDPSRGKRNTKNIDMVKIEIHSILSGKRFYEFPSVEQAQKFLEEFDLDKVSKA